MVVLQHCLKQRIQETGVAEQGVSRQEIKDWRKEAEMLGRRCETGGLRHGKDMGDRPWEI